MIIGTAGHIDHGKTSLVRALTGVETDRLPEEKRRGISIELGYAYLHTDDGVSLGFVDVPGHEKLLHTMLAGATGIAHALLVVAADDGVMPQTREHFAVVSLLGVQGATVAITKVDRLDAATRDARIAEVRAEIAQLLTPTALAGSPMFEVSAISGEGITTLRDHLIALARQHDGAPATQGAPTTSGFRMSVDRAFTLAGIGTVVTGSITEGTVKLGDELTLSPSGKPVRVRGIHALNRQAESANKGQRSALALAGVTKDEVHRGEWISADSIAEKSSEFHRSDRVPNAISPAKKFILGWIYPISLIIIAFFTSLYKDFCNFCCIAPAKINLRFFVVLHKKRGRTLPYPASVLFALGSLSP